MNNNKICKKFKSSNGLYNDIDPIEKNCKECVYFSSRNCGMDAAESLPPIVDIFC